MTVTFTGVPLCFEDDSGEVARFVERYLQWPHSQVNSPKRTLDVRSRCQRPLWPQQPPLKPNTLFVPTGASRWTQFLGLATQDAMEQILANLSGTTACGLLQFGTLDQDNTPVTVDSEEDVDGTYNAAELIETFLYVLPPVPVSQGEEALWLLPMVDARYYFSQASFCSAQTTWAGLFGEIAAALNIAITSDASVSRNYGIPDSCIFRNGLIDAAAALDLACWATNQRFVVKNIGESDACRKYVLRSEATAPVLYVNQLSAIQDGLGAAAGDAFNIASSADVPQQIQFHFTNDTNADQFVYSQPAGSAPEWAAGLTRELMCPALYTPASQASLQAMADRWCADWWQWTVLRFSWGFNGILDWHFSGFEDYALYDMSRNKDGTYQARTFVKSLPPSVGYDFVPVQLASTPTRACPSGLTAPDTTTTPNPSNVAIAPCSGTCKWVWSAPATQWSLSSNACGTTTTTTPNPASTTTSSTTTTFNPVPCELCNSTTTSTSTSTTTTPAPCNCTYPLYCGSSDGECTHTGCSNLANFGQSSCPTSTSSTTPGPTTTTTSGPCNTCCNWGYVPDGAGSGQWILVSNNCPSICPGCTAPVAVSVGCTFICISGGGGGSGGTTTTTCSPCFGNCSFVSVQIQNASCGLSDQWGWSPQFLCGSGAEVSDCAVFCQCVPPSIAAPAYCSTIYTACAKQVPLPSGTTSTTGTSTTPGPCSACKWAWNGTVWNVTINNCSPCSCQYPAYNGTDASCETAWTPCGFLITTTSTTPGSTTTSTSTSTTTTLPPNNSICCYADNTGTGATACLPAVDCGCPPTYDGLIFAACVEPAPEDLCLGGTPCAIYGSTTTSSTTSTTTTLAPTTSTTPGPTTTTSGGGTTSSTPAPTTTTSGGGTTGTTATTTTTLAPTTTTAAPCGNCYYISILSGDAYVWIPDTQTAGGYDHCTGNCDCNSPGYAPTEAGEFAGSACS